jgi:hypothetical protein
LNSSTRFVYLDWRCLPNLTVSKMLFKNRKRGSRVLQSFLHADSYHFKSRSRTRQQKQKTRERERERERRKDVVLQSQPTRRLPLWLRTAQLRSNPWHIYAINIPVSTYSSDRIRHDMALLQLRPPTTATATASTSCPRTHRDAAGICHRLDSSRHHHNNYQFRNHAHSRNLRRARHS